MNSEKIVRYPSIPDEEKRLAEDLLWNRGADPVAAFANFFKAKGAAPKAPRERAGTPLERLPRYILEGSKEGLVEDLEAVRESVKAPLDITTVRSWTNARGRPALQRERADRGRGAAVRRAMKAPSPISKVHGEDDGFTKGQGPPRDGQGRRPRHREEPVEIILSNTVRGDTSASRSLPRTLEAYHQHQPDLIGLSGLLVKSAQQMVTTAQDLTAAGVETPMLVGGAALSQKFTDHRIAPAYAGLAVYAEDAMRGLALADRILSGDDAREGLAAEAQKRRAAIAAVARTDQDIPLAAPAVRTRRSRSRARAGANSGARSGRADLAEVWPYLNPHSCTPNTSACGQLLEAQGAAIEARRARARHREVREGWLTARAMYRTFPRPRT